MNICQIEDLFMSNISRKESRSWCVCKNLLMWCNLHDLILSFNYSTIKTVEIYHKKIVILLFIILSRYKFDKSLQLFM